MPSAPFTVTCAAGTGCAAAVTANAAVMHIVVSRNRLIFMAVSCSRLYSRFQHAHAPQDEIDEP
jgi:hypothetical protein